MIGNEKQIYSVTSLTRELKGLVENKYRFLQVQGEISNLKIPFSGHHYFTLKDDGAQIRAVLFKGQTRYLEKALQDGQQVVCHGRLSIYEPRGDYQIIIDNVDFQGSGLLQAQFEKLKKQLQAEGLFDSERKRTLPPYPGNIVLITSATGAAVHDFISIWKKRAFPAAVKIYPVRVQGKGAAEEIAEAVSLVNEKLSSTEIIVLCRGGGALEDLWAFNEEVLARAIFSSVIPIVSAVGHEIDYTISDFCADVRAATPTAAAEIIFPNFNELQKQLAVTKERMALALLSLLQTLQQRMTQNRRLLGDMRSLFTNVSLRLDHTIENFAETMQQRLDSKQLLLNELTVKIQNLSPETRLNIQQQRLSFATTNLFRFFRQQIEEKTQTLSRQAGLLDAVSPLATLARGYAIAEKLHKNSGKRQLLYDASQVKNGDTVSIRLHKGIVDCRVLDTD